MDTQDVPTLSRAIEAAGLAIPPAVTAAEEIRTAAIDLRASIEAEGTPTEQQLDPTKGVKGLTALHRAMVEHASHAARHDAARRLEASSEALVLRAWASSALELMTPLGVAFDKAAATFTEALQALGGTLDTQAALTGGLAADHATAIAAAGKLSALAAARDVLAGIHRTGILPTTLDAMTRICSVASREHISAVLPNRLDTPQWSAAWWAQLAQTPGVHLKWHTPEQQRTLVAAMPTHAHRIDGRVASTA